MFKCDKCGHVEEQAEGMLLFDDNCYYMVQCVSCKKVDSVKIAIRNGFSSGFPRCECCDSEMVQWDRCCPECGQKMTEKILCSDVI